METKSFGEFLKNERRLRNVSLEEISRFTCINIRYLQAIEDNEFDIIPAEPFVKGFIRSFAGYLGLDVDDVILTYEYYQKMNSSNDGYENFTETKSLSASRKLVLIITVLISLLIFIIILAYHFSRFTPFNQSDEVQVPVRERILVAGDMLMPRYSVTGNNRYTPIGCNF